MAKQVTETDTREAAPEAETATAGQAETASAPKPAQDKPTPKDVSQPASSAAMVEATLKARWSSGGRPHEAGETVTMTRGTYERLKQYGRVE